MTTETIPSPNAPPRRRPQWIGLNAAAMVFVVGFIVQLNSERAYWFYSPDWFTTQIGETLGVAAFYGFAAAAALWILGRIPYRGTHQLILAGA
ncbi:MAG: hypothetical protein QNJ88_16405, partial [Acidimicrobiia bacterium]|nr:hypothetical protein [Acidimicrobiia bacterium]